LSPDDITRTLGITPTKTGKKGERWSKGTAIVEKNVWILYSELENEITIEDHVRRFAEIIEEKADQVRSLLTSSGTYIDMLCDFGNDSGQYPLTLEPELLTRLSNLSVTLHLTWWMPSTDEINAKEF
jgi:hypothetical protein